MARRYAARAAAVVAAAAAEDAAAPALPGPRSTDAAYLYLEGGVGCRS